MFQRRKFRIFQLYWKRDTNASVFLWILWNFLRTPFLQNTSGWLLLYIESFQIDLLHETMKYKSVMFFFSFKFSEVESVMGYCVIYTMLKTESFFFFDVLSGNTLSLVFVRWQGWEVFKILVIKSGMARGKGGCSKTTGFSVTSFLNRPIQS